MCSLIGNFPIHYCLFAHSIPWREGSTPCNSLYREAPSKRGTFFRRQVYERIGISLVRVYKINGRKIIIKKWHNYYVILVVKRQKSANRYILWLSAKKLRKLSGFVVYLYFEDCEFTAVKKDGKFWAKYVKGVQFANRGYMNRASDISHGRRPAKFRYFREIQVFPRNPAKFPQKCEIPRNPPEKFPNTCRQNIFNTYLGY